MPRVRHFAQYNYGNRYGHGQYGYDPNAPKGPLIEAMEPYVFYVVDNWPYISGVYDTFVVCLAVFNVLAHFGVNVAMLTGGAETVWRSTVCGVKFETPGCGVQILLSKTIFEVGALAFYFLSGYPSASFFLFLSQIFTMGGADAYSLTQWSRPEQSEIFVMRFFMIEVWFGVAMVMDVGQQFELWEKWGLYFAAKGIGFGWCYVVRRVMLKLRMAVFEELPIEEEEEEEADGEPKPAGEADGATTPAAAPAAAASSGEQKKDQ